MDVKKERGPRFVEGGEGAEIGAFHEGKDCGARCGIGGQIRLGVGLPSKGRRNFRRGLVYGGGVSREGVCIDPHKTEVVQRFARDSVEQERVTQLGHLRHGIHAAAVAFDRYEVRWRGNVPVPNVVPQLLKMPEPPSGRGVEGQDAVGEQVVPLMIDADEVRFWGAKSNVCDAPRFVHRHSTPAVCAAFQSTPCFVAVFAVRRARLECPQALSVAGVVAVDVAAVTGEHADISMHGSHSSSSSRHMRFAFVPKARNRLSCFRIQGDEPVAVAE